MILNMAVNPRFYRLMTLTWMVGLIADLAVGITIEGPESNHFNKHEYIVKRGENVVLACSDKYPIEWVLPEDQSNKSMKVSTNYTHTNPKNYKGMLYIKEVDYSDVGAYMCREKYEKSSYISTYLYVQGASQLYVGEKHETIDYIFVPESVQEDRRPFVIPCKPTDPDIEVKLYQMSSLGDQPETIILNRKNYDGGIWTFDGKRGFEWKNPVLPHTSTTKTMLCVFHSQKRNKTDTKIVHCNVFRRIDYVNKPKIYNGTSEDYFGETYALNLICVENYNAGSKIPHLTWYKDGHEISILDDRIYIPKSAYYRNNVTSYLNIKSLVKATDAGRYTCEADNTDTTSQSHIDVDILERGDYFINIDAENHVYNISANAHEHVTLGAQVLAFPRANVEWRNNQGQLIQSNNDNGKYFSTAEGNKHILHIYNATVDDIGNYTITARNSEHVLNTASFSVFVISPPSIEANVKPFNMVNSRNEISCSVKGYPQPEVQLFFKRCQDEGCKFEKLTPQIDYSGYTTTATITMQRNQSGSVRCIGNNAVGTTEAVKPYIVTDVEDGFQIWTEENRKVIRLNNKVMKVACGDEVTLYCASTKQIYTEKRDWYHNNQHIDDEKVSKSVTGYSYKLRLSIKAIAKSDAGKYICEVEKDTVEKEIESQTVQLEVTEPEKPNIVDTNLNRKMDDLIFPEQHKLYCMFDGVPRPEVTWRKDGHEYIPDGTRVKFEHDSQQIHFLQTDVVDEGAYECIGENRIGGTKLSAIMRFSNTTNITSLCTYAIIFIGILCAIILVVSPVLVYLFYTRKPKTSKRRLSSADSKHGESQVESNNSIQTDVDDQSDLILDPENRQKIPRKNTKLAFIPSSS